MAKLSAPTAGLVKQSGLAKRQGSGDCESEADAEVEVAWTTPQLSPGSMGSLSKGSLILGQMVLSESLEGSE